MMKTLLLLLLTFTCFIYASNAENFEDNPNIPTIIATKLRPMDSTLLPEIKTGSNQFQKFPMARVEGHRGAGFMEPENTLKSFQRAIDLGLDGIETDVWLSQDKELIVYHGLIGGYVEFKDGKRKLTEIDSHDLKNYTLLNGEKILFFEEVLDLCKDKISINIEIKDTREEIVENILDMLLEKDMLGQVSFSSFHHYLRKKLTSEVQKRGIKEDLSFGFLNHIYDLRFPEYGVDTLPGDSLNLDIRYLTGSQEKCLDTMAKAAEYGMNAKFWFPWFYTIEELSYDKLIEVGVDTILTNKPQAVLDYLARKQNEQNF